MPPVGDRLSPAEIESLRAWIDQGAVWPEQLADSSVSPLEKRGKEHWAFRPLANPKPPTVKNRAWVRNSIDEFVLAKLEGRGWQPAPAAAPAVLLRRIHLDLTGLPPTLAEQAAFTTPEAADHVVDELLSRPTYGERWARHWLDLVRYAETNGYERDAVKPHAWRYRDYVIRAFNDDKPFDRFIVEQLAGDELPASSADSLVATGYYRLGPWDDEPADPDTDRFDQLDDIVSTTSQAFLGITLGCARCHDHKFEPLTAEDYYRVLAIFNGLERPRKGRTELDLPIGTQNEIAAWMVRERQTTPLKKYIADLQEAWRDILRRARLIQHHKITREELSVREHMSMVLKKLQGRKFVEFENLFDVNRGVPVLIVTLIATLERAKENLIELTQAEAYAPIYVRLAYQPA